MGVAANKAAIARKLDLIGIVTDRYTAVTLKTLSPAHGELRIPTLELKLEDLERYFPSTPSLYNETRCDSWSQGMGEATP